MPYTCWSFCWYRKDEMLANIHLYLTQNYHMDYTQRDKFSAAVSLILSPFPKEVFITQKLKFALKEPSYLPALSVHIPPHLVEVSWVKNDNQKPIQDED